MKNIKWLSGVFIMALGLLALSACSEDDNNTQITFPEKQPIDCAVKEEKTLTFNAEQAWTLSSSRLWCKFKEGNDIVSSLSGGAGEQTITLTVTEDVWGFEDAIAELTLGMGGQTQVIAVVNRAAKNYHIEVYKPNGTDKVYYNDENPVTLVYPNNRNDITEVSIITNFDWKVKDCPEWVQVEEKDLMGEASQTMAWELRFNPTDNFSKVTPHVAALEFVDANGALRLSIPLKYDGMPEDIIEFIRPQKDYWNWFFSADATKFWQTNGMSEGVTEYDAPMIFSAISRSGFEIVHIDINEYGYNPRETTYYPSFHWFKAEKQGDKGEVSIQMQPNEGSDRQGCIMAIPTKVLNALPGGIYDLVYEDGSAINYEYEKYIAIEFTQKSAQGAAKGFIVKDDAGHSMASMLMDMSTQVPKDELITLFGTENVFMLTLEASKSYSTIEVLPNGYPANTCQFEIASSWNGITVEPNYNKGIYIMDISAGEKGEMRITFFAEGKVHGVLLLTQY